MTAAPEPTGPDDGAGDRGRRDPEGTPERGVDDGAEAVRADHDADGPPDDRQAHAADAFLAEQDPADAARVASHHREMDRLGAEVRGEGEI